MGGEVVIVVAGVALIAASLLTFVVMLPALHAWAIVTLWGWFLTGYATVPPIAAVYGALLVLSLVRRLPEDPKRTPKEAWWHLGMAAARPFIVVGFAWILKGWL